MSRGRKFLVGIIVIIGIGAIGTLAYLLFDASRPDSHSNESEAASEEQAAESEAQVEEAESKNVEEEQSQKKESSSYIALTKPQYVYYKSGDEYYGGFFFGYVNNGDTPIEVGGFDVRITDSDGVEVSADNVNCNFAPAILEPGDVGFAVSSTPIENGARSMTVEAKVKEAQETDKTPPLKCADADIVDDAVVVGNTDGLTASVVIQNTTDEEETTATVVVGIIGNDGDLIGVAFGTPDTIDPKEEVEYTCLSALAKNGLKRDEISKLRARARAAF